MRTFLVFYGAATISWVACVSTSVYYGLTPLDILDITKEEKFYNCAKFGILAVIFVILSFVIAIIALKNAKFKRAHPPTVN